MKKKKINNKERKQIKQKKTDGNSKSKTQQNRGVPPLCHTPAACGTETTVQILLQTQTGQTRKSAKISAAMLPNE